MDVSDVTRDGSCWLLLYCFMAMCIAIIGVRLGQEITTDCVAIEPGYLAQRQMERRGNLCVCLDLPHGSGCRKSGVGLYEI